MHRWDSGFESLGLRGGRHCIAEFRDCTLRWIVAANRNHIVRGGLNGKNGYWNLSVVLGAGYDRLRHGRKRRRERRSLGLAVGLASSSF